MEVMAAEGIHSSPDQLPPDMVRFRDGTTMTVESFLAKYGARLTTVPDAEIFYEVPAYEPDKEHVLHAMIIGLSTAAAAFLIKNPVAGAAIGAAVGDYIAGKPMPAHVSSMKISDLMGRD